MSNNTIVLNIQDSPLAHIWLKLGIASLIFAGLFSLLLVLSRTPGIQTLIPWLDFFHTALVVHVNLSVLIWFMSFAGLFWSIYTKSHFFLLEKLALLFAISGTIIIIISPFAGAGNPLINNYIPVLQHPIFLSGLAIFSIGILLQTFRALCLWPRQFNQVFEVASYIAALICVASAGALVWSYIEIPDDLEAITYYEFLFWGSGHILQFTHTCFVLFSWLLLAEYIGVNIKIKPILISAFFILLLSPLIPSLSIYLNYEIVSSEHRQYFTDVMKYGGLTSLPLGLLIIWSLSCSWPEKLHKSAAVRAALFSSIILFAAGGIIGFLIHGINVVIPAHYHGSIVGITLAFMGIAYYLLPKFGYRNPEWKMARIQPYIYGGGQLMHILGLAWSGGYGVQRKTAGAAQGLENLPEVAGMAMMGTGGLISIIGGIMFLVVILRSMWPEKSQAIASS